jgi:nucleoside-diphosphate-sugar epimerase
MADALARYKSLTMNVFVAGAAGALGARLVPILLVRGHRVVGTTRSASKAGALRAAGVEPVLIDVFDAPVLTKAVASARPDVIVHLLSDLPPGLPVDRMEEGTRRNARMRSEGTRNLVAAALGAGVRRVVAHSIAWMYTPGQEPHGEGDPLDVHAAGTRAITARGVADLERWVLSSPPIQGTVLRLGHLYGPGTGAEAAAVPALHVEAAAAVLLLTVEGEHPGIFNVAEPSGQLSTDNVQRELGFDPGRWPSVAARAAHVPSAPPTGSR